METPGPKLTRFELPGEAGKLRRDGKSIALVRELGDNYHRYHEFLADELARWPKRPERENYSDGDSFLGDWQHIHEIVKTEAFLRACREFRRGKRRDFGWDKSVPLVDANDRLVRAP